MTFFSWPFNENFKFLKNCPYDFHKILHSHFTPKGAPVCAMASKLYDWMWKTAKISPKMAKKQPFPTFFRFSQKLSIRFKQNFLQSFYTTLEPICALAWKSYGWDGRNIAIFLLFSVFSKTHYRIRTKLSTVVLRHNMVLWVQFQ